MGDSGSSMAFGMFVVALVLVLVGLFLGLAFMALRRWAKKNGRGALGAVFGLLAFGSWGLLAAGVLAVVSMFTG